MPGRDIAASLAIREQAGAHKPTVGLVLGIVTAYTSTAVTAAIGDELVTAPKLRSYTNPLIGDAVLLGRSGSSVWCLGALNLGPAPEPPEDPDPPPPPPPPPEETTTTIRATYTGAFSPGIGPINQNPQLTTDLTGYTMQRGTMVWTNGGVRISSTGDIVFLLTWPPVPNPGAGMLYIVRARGRVERQPTNAPGAGTIMAGINGALNQIGPDEAQLTGIGWAIPQDASGSFSWTSGAYNFASYVDGKPYVCGFIGMNGNGGIAWIDSLEIFAIDNPAALLATWADSGTDIPQGTPPTGPARIGAAFYGDSPSSLGGTAISATVRIRREIGGVPASLSPMLRLLAEREPPAGPPTFIGAAINGPPMAPGDIADVELPQGWAQALLAGTAGGIGTDTSGPQLMLAGANSWPSAFDLTITRTES